MAKATSPDRLHGFVIVDKPGSWTSHDVVGWMRRLLGERQIGHAGTLDPAATGVLPIGVGSATRLMEYLSNATKSYVATLRFGVETDSFDGDGRVTATTDAQDLDRPVIENALAAWLGPRLQEPPMHSAIRIDGKRLYEHARQGLEVDRPMRQVTFSTLTLLRWQPPDAEVFVDCSKGTYVRSLARDIGRDVGTGAYLANLVRNRTGPFRLCQAWTLAQLQERWATEGADSWSEIAHHPDAVVSDWPALLLDPIAESRWMSGQTVDSSLPAAGRCRAFGPSGEWRGVGEASSDGSAWQPKKVAGGRG